MKSTISHLYQDKESGEWIIQSNEEHSKGVADLASDFAGKFGLPSWGYALGILHDKGKERNSFQQYIRQSSGFSSEVKTIHEHTHAFAGGLLAKEIMGKGTANLLINQIVSHHSGLHDYTDLEKLLEDKELPDEIDKEDIKINPSALLKELQQSVFFGKDSVMKNEYFHHLSRMLFSCLVDADRLDTERFMNYESWKIRNSSSTLVDLLPKLEAFLKKLQSNSSETEVNRIRKKVQEQCALFADKEKGFYSLTVPTGGGKTLSSLLWAMKHAVFNKMDRIIIAIPYTSIIVQTASQLKEIFGEENVLEHHSSFNPEEIRDAEVREKIKLVTENWNSPIIVTTNVQLFESMFSNRPSNCRKLHNIANSVILLDEAQTLPTDFLMPIVDAMKAYQKMFGISMLFTTASQPVLSGVIENPNSNNKFEGIEKITEIIPKEFALHDKLRRVNLHIDKEGSTYDDIAARIAKHDRVLCIVNTRQDAKEIYDRLPDNGIKIHLSRMMCPDHIGETIRKIKLKLKDSSCPTIRVIATQLVEAGVDIDFPVVFRQEAGLDSVLQAAGRCNREGKSNIGQTFVFSLSAENRLPYGDIADANNARKNLPADSDWFSPSTMEQYFHQLYSRKKTFDINDIKHYLYKINELCFEKASEKFQLIEDDCINVIVNWKDGMELVEKLKEEGCSYLLMKQLSKYTVGVRRSDFKVLVQSGLIEEIIEGIYILPDRAQYDANTGLSLENHWMEEILMI